MSFQTVLSIVGIVFTAFELYQRFRQKDSSGGVQNTISPRAEPKQSGAPTSVAGTSEAQSVAPTSEEKRSVVQNSEWCDNNNNLFFSCH